MAVKVAQYAALRAQPVGVLHPGIQPAHGRAGAHQFIRRDEGIDQAEHLLSDFVGQAGVLRRGNNLFQVLPRGDEGFDQAHGIPIGFMVPQSGKDLVRGRSQLFQRAFQQIPERTPVLSQRPDGTVGKAAVQVLSVVIRHKGSHFGDSLYRPFPRFGEIHGVAGQPLLREEIADGRVYGLFVQIAKRLPGGGQGGVLLQIIQGALHLPGEDHGDLPALPGIVGILPHQSKKGIAGGRVLVEEF